VTPHLGVRFDPQYRGPGLRIRDVLPNGPAAREESRLQAGEVILEIDGRPVDPGRDLAEILNGDLKRDIRLAVRDGVPTGHKLPPLEGDEPPAERDTRDVVLRPISYSQARSLLYDKWLDDNRQQVERLSSGQLGYLHIRAMNMSSFWEFERQLYHVGYGKDGLVIDVRENGGGSTTDRLLTALTQPEHAITVPRGGGPGYPQSRRVYATWSKPIVVLCNQNSFSNAEIFSHAIKGLGRGRLVGVPTAGGVISTGAVRVMDIGLLRLPFRGWFVRGTGEDMELNGAVPDVIVWPEPGELPAGRDRQLEKAVELLREDVQQWRQRPQPTLRRATERSSDD
jgi:tricorn protease